MGGDYSPSDPPLTELGHAQSARAGLALSGQAVTALYTSPMMRAMQTAKALHEVLGLPMQVRVELAETYLPAWPAPPGSDEPIPKRGLTIAEARTMFSAQVSEDVGWMRRGGRLMFARGPKARMHARQPR